MRKRAEYLTRSEAQDLPVRLLTERAADKTCIEALEALELLTGHKLGPDRKTAITLALTGSGWTKAEVLMACKALTFDETLCNTLAHQGTVTPADFERVRGTSKHVAHARLYDFHEARYIWEKRTGGADTEAGPKMTDMFMPVQVDGRDKPMWRMR